MNGLNIGCASSKVQVVAISLFFVTLVIAILSLTNNPEYAKPYSFGSILESDNVTIFAFLALIFLCRVTFRCDKHWAGMIFFIFVAGTFSIGYFAGAIELTLNLYLFWIIILNYITLFFFNYNVQRNRSSKCYNRICLVLIICAVGTLCTQWYLVDINTLLPLAFLFLGLFKDHTLYLKFWKYLKSFKYEPHTKPIDGLSTLIKWARDDDSYYFDIYKDTKDKSTLEAWASEPERYKSIRGAILHGGKGIGKSTRVGSFLEIKDILIVKVNIVELITCENPNALLQVIFSRIRERLRFEGFFPELEMIDSTLDKLSGHFSLLKWLVTSDLEAPTISIHGRLEKLGKILVIVVEDMDRLKDICAKEENEIIIPKYSFNIENIYPDINLTNIKIIYLGKLNSEAIRGEFETIQLPDTDKVIHLFLNLFISFPMGFYATESRQEKFMALLFILLAEKAKAGDSFRFLKHYTNRLNASFGLDKIKRPTSTLMDYALAFNYFLQEFDSKESLEDKLYNYSDQFRNLQEAVISGDAKKEDITKLDEEWDKFFESFFGIERYKSEARELLTDHKRLCERAEIVIQIGNIIKEYKDKGAMNAEEKKKFNDDISNKLGYLVASIPPITYGDYTLISLWSFQRGPYGVRYNPLNVFETKWHQEPLKSIASDANGRKPPDVLYLIVSELYEYIRENEERNELVRYENPKVTGFSTLDTGYNDKVNSLTDTLKEAYIRVCKVLFEGDSRFPDISFFYDTSFLHRITETVKRDFLDPAVIIYLKYTMDLRIGHAGLAFVELPLREINPKNNAGLDSTTNLQTKIKSVTTLLQPTSYNPWNRMYPLTPRALISNITGETGALDAETWPCECYKKDWNKSNMDKFVEHLWNKAMEQFPDKIPSNFEGEPNKSNAYEGTIFHELYPSTWEAWFGGRNLENLILKVGSPNPRINIKGYTTKFSINIGYMRQLEFQEYYTDGLQKRAEYNYGILSDGTSHYLFWRPMTYRRPRQIDTEKSSHEENNREFYTYKLDKSEGVVIQDGILNVHPQMMMELLNWFQIWTKMQQDEKHPYLDTLTAWTLWHNKEGRSSLARYH